MVDTQPSSELSGASQPTVALKEPEVWRLNEMLRDVVEKIGKNPVIMETPDYHDWYAKVEAGLDTGDTGWWEAFSHGLVMPLDGDFNLSQREQDKGFYDKLRDLAPKKGVIEAYLELETDFLRMDEKGFARQYAPKYPEPLQIEALSAAQSLMLRVVAFSELRKQLAQEGFVFPENPAMQEAIDAVRAATARDARPAAFAVLGGGPKPLAERAARTGSDELPSH